MKSFYEYLADVKQEYQYKLKFAFALGEEQIDKIENYMKRHDALEFKTPTKSILQANQIDFMELGPVEVTTIVVNTEHPIYPPAVREELAKLLGKNVLQVVVRGANEPIETEHRIASEYEKLDAEIEGEIATLIGNDDPVENGIVGYGDEYNKSLLNYLAKTREDAAKAEEERRGVPVMFGWLESHVEGDDFNKDHDTVKPVSKSKDAKAPTAISAEKNYDDRIKSASRVVKDGDGVKKVKGK